MMKMKIFGGFALYGPDAMIDEKSLHSNKLVRLLVYILLHRQRDLTHQELIDTFWEDDGSRNPEGALKNLIYRLRSELKALGPQDLILTASGAYRWNPEVPVEADYEIMEQSAKRAKSESDPEERIRLMERATALYRNEASQRLATQSWMVSRLTYYRLLYLDTVKLLAEQYAQRADWEKVESLCRQALEVDFIDEDLHYWLIRSQIGRRNHEAAIACYENAKQMIYDHLGIRDVERFDGLYDQILALSDHQMADMGSLMQSVCEKERPTGVFTCEYPVFREIYRVEARRIRRTGVAEYILLITMKKSGRTVADPQDESIKSGMQALGDLLNTALRSGDVVARYSSSQYVVLLPTCTYESALLVSDRIDRRFRSVMGKKRLSLQFEVEEVQEMAAAREQA